jgi:hypothetical protein
LEPISPVSALAGPRQIAQYSKQILGREKSDDVIYEIRPNPGDIVDLGTRRDNIREHRRNQVLADLGIGRRFNTIG